MRRKSGFTIEEQAIALVPKFKKVTKRMEEQVVLRGQSISTLSNYIRRIDAFVAHFGKLPEAIEPDEINTFLVALAGDSHSPSSSTFKHRVYKLRYYYRVSSLTITTTDERTKAWTEKRPMTGMSMLPNSFQF